MPRAKRGIAVVCEVGWVNGLAALRSLGRAGLRVLAVDHRPWALGLRSRYAEPVIAPDPLEDEDGFLARLAELGRTLDEPVPVFPTHDEHLNAIARNAGALGDPFRYPFPSWDVLERVQEKRHQLDKAVEVGMGVPRTLHPRSVADARAAGEGLGYPVFVKPSKPQEFKQRYGRQAYRCETWPELEEAYGRMEPYEPMVQEWIPGGDGELYTLGSYIAPDGTPLGLFCGRKLRQTLPWMGSCRIGEAVWVDRVVEDGLRLLRALGYHGISQVEVKRDPRDGVFKLIEVNPRLWQWHGLAAACGVDLPLIAWRDLTGDPPQRARMTNEGKRWAISFMAGQGTALQRPPYVDGVFALDDPRPALTQARRYAMRGAARAGVRLPARRPAARPRPQTTRPR